MSKWYEIKAQAEDGPAQVYLFGEVGESVFGESKSALAFIDELKGLGDRDVDLHINSLGGDVFDGQAIFTALRHHKGAVTTYIDGVAASIAALVALAGDHVVMAANGAFMVHKAWGTQRGNEDDMLGMAEILEKVDRVQAALYTAKTGTSESDMHDAMRAETWYFGQEAVDAGFVDELGDELDLAACVRGFDLSAHGFQHVPDRLRAAAEAPPDPPEEEAGDTPVTVDSQLVDLLAKRRHDPPKE